MPFIIIFGTTAFFIALYIFRKREIRQIENIDFKVFALENGLSYLDQDDNVNDVIIRKELAPSAPLKPRHIFSSKLLSKELKIFDACYLRPGKDEKALMHIATLIKIEPYSFPRFALRNDSKRPTGNFFAFVDGLPRAKGYNEVINRKNSVVGLYAYLRNRNQIETFLSDKSSILSVFRDENIQLLMFNKQFCCAYIPGRLRKDIDYYLTVERSAEKLIEALFSDSLKAAQSPNNHT